MLSELVLLLAVSANPLTGKVVAVADGDTLTLLVERTQVKIRLAGIDAPEKGQAFGSKSKDALADKVFGKEVHVETQGQDKYGRTLGTVFVRGRNINLEMVEGGWAWQYRKYDTSRTLAEAEAKAHKAKLGLWADPHAIPPWEWRAAGRDKAGVATKSLIDQPAGTGFWLTASSGIRHNSRCTNYRNTKGRECGPNEGRPCKICGG